MSYNNKIVETVHLDMYAAVQLIWCPLTTAVENHPPRKWQVPYDCPAGWGKRFSPVVNCRTDLISHLISLATNLRMQRLFLIVKYELE